jgi:hypothetical protein
MLMRIFLAGFLMFGVGVTAVQAQEGEAKGEAWIELMRQDIKTQKVAIITAVMDFTDAQSETFWPIYREYDHERSALGDQHIALLKSYAEVYDSLNEENSKQLITDWYKLQDADLKLRKKYAGKIEKAMSAVTAARFVQVENQIDLLMDLEIASNLPLLQRGMEEVQTMEAKSKK